MSTFSLTNTGSEIDSAIAAVHAANNPVANAGPSDANNQNMITNGAVFTAINNLSLANLAGSALVTESEGIANNDNDTTIPTSAAVKDFVNTTGLVIREFSINLPGGRRTGHPSNTHYHNSITVNISGFTQIFHIELAPKSHGAAIPSAITTPSPATDGFLMTFNNTSATFAGPLGIGGSASNDTGNGFTTTYRVFGIEP
tara:strand:+ start:3343 stop:3942 length:600 start_codon:yes stop_codon:yes gene_type:complete